MNERNRVAPTGATAIALLVAGALVAPAASAWEPSTPIHVADSRGGGGFGGGFGSDRGGFGGGDRGSGARGGPGQGANPGPARSGAEHGPTNFANPDRSAWPAEGRRGPVLEAPSRNAIVAGRGGDRYYYDRGNWYAPRGPRYVIVSPPIGFVVTRLPSYYTTVWYGGVPYFYAGGTYYLWREHERAYEIVDAPAPTASSTPSSAPDDLYVYPKQGQDEEKQASDRYECHRWSADQTGFDPTQPESGTDRSAQQSKREEYRRAMTACLEGRGYSVR